MPLRTFVVNSSHYVPNSYNTFRFPLAGNPYLTDCKIGVESVSVYNSTFNIMGILGNNSLTVGFPSSNATVIVTPSTLLTNPVVITAAGSQFTFNSYVNANKAALVTSQSSAGIKPQAVVVPVTTTNPYYPSYKNYTFTFPESYMSISDMNLFIQSQCIKYGLYAINSLGQNVYFIELVVNSNQYAAQLNLYPIPVMGATPNVSMQGWTTPPLSANLIFQAKDYYQVLPLVQFSQQFGNLLGLNAVNKDHSLGYDNAFTGYGGPSCFSAISVLSQFTPNINPVNSYILTCSLLNCPYSIPNNIFYSIPLNGPLGSLISIQSSNAVMNDIMPNHYEYIEIRLNDQNMNPLIMQDTNIVLTLALLDNKAMVALKQIGGI